MRKRNSKYKVVLVLYYTTEKYGIFHQINKMDHRISIICVVVVIKQGGRA